MKTPKKELSEEARERQRQASRAWYLKNKEAVLEKKRLAYKNDPKYRKRAIKNSRARSRNRKRLAASKKGKAYRPKYANIPLIDAVKSVKKNTIVPRYVKTSDGHAGFHHSIVVAAAYFGVSSNTIRRWCNVGVFPGVSIYVAGNRMFSEPFLKAARSGLHKAHKLPKHTTEEDMKREVLNALNEAGVSWVTGEYEKTRVYPTAKRKD